MQKLFYQRQQKDSFSAYNLKYKGELSKALVLYPVASSKQMLEIHRHFTLPFLQQAYDGIHKLQESIKELQEKIPEGIYCFMKNEYENLGFSGNLGENRIINSLKFAWY